MGGYRPEDFEMDKSESDEAGEHGRTVKKSTKIRFATEDVIAGVAGLIALLFAVAMVAGRLPVNRLTVGVLGFSGSGAVIAQILKARSGASRGTSGRRGGPAGRG